MIDVAYGQATDVGRVRSENEDDLLAAPPVFVVADGMGGHAGGAAASSAAVEEMAALARRDDLDPEQVRAAVAAAHARVRALSRPDGSRLGAGTTLTGLVAVTHEGSPTWLVLNVGDSRVYRLAGDSLLQVTTDHSLVQEMVDDGVLSAQDARFHPQRNVVTRALGGPGAVEPDLTLAPPQPSERWLVCSDGLTNELTDDEIAEVLRVETDPQAAADRLVQAAVQAGGQDNVTVVVVDVAGAA